MFNYSLGNHWVYRLSPLAKIIAFLFWTSALMASFDIRFLAGSFLILMIIFISTGDLFKRMLPLVLLIFVFLILNFFFTYIFDPLHGSKFYESMTVLFKINDYLVVTSEELFFLTTQFFKYICMLPLGMLLFLTSSPSDFGGALSKLKVSDKVCMSVTIALRYVPDIVNEYKMISYCQQARGIEMTNRVGVFKRLKRYAIILIPLVFSSLDHVEDISNAMDLRGFDVNKNRTYYGLKKMEWQDYLLIIISAIIFITIFWLVFVEHKSIYNPFI